MQLSIKTSTGKYDVIIEKNCLSNASQYLNLNRKVLIITDDGIPTQYIDVVKNQCEKCFVYTIKQGEASKNFDNYQKILGFLLENSFSRKDVIVAIGGGVVGDLSGFVAATYMRGIDFYNIPTTLLSQVDSSIGGKTAIDFLTYKNIVGAFYPPKVVLIDALTLNTLSKRQLHAGLVEAIKMAATFNENLFKFIENSNDLLNDIEEIIYQSLLIKKDVVEKDEKESNLRKVLNFGHSVGHAIESYYNMSLLHGECVGLGILYMVDKNIKPRFINILKKYDLPYTIDVNFEKLVGYINHDKKASDDKIDIIYVEKIGSYQIRNIKVSDIYNYLDKE